MEFRARVATAGGEISESVYVADSEDRLRRELEDKGLFVLSLQRRGMLPAFGNRGRRRTVKRQEFLVFNQELATLLKAGMPLKMGSACLMSSGYGNSSAATLVMSSLAQWISPPLRNCRTS